MTEEKKESGVTPRQKKSAAAVFGAIVGTAVLAAVCICAGWILNDMWPKGDPAAGQKAQVAAMMSAPQTVAVTKASMRAYNLPETFVAHTEALQEVALLPQVDGYISEIKFSEGDIVEEGQVLYVIDDERYRAVVRQREADLEAAEAEERRAARYYERMQNADERGVTRLERDNAEAASDKAKAAVLQAKANLVVAQYDLKKALVVAPISGKIGKSAAHKGDYVAPSKGALARIVQTDPIRVRFAVPDRLYTAWRKKTIEGQTDDVRLRLELSDGTVYGEEGKWDFDDNQMSLETASIMIRASFPNPSRLLVPDSYVKLLVDFKNPPSYLSIPQQCLCDTANGKRCVWVVADDATVVQREVVVKEPFEGWMPVVEGIAEGDTVVLSGVSKLRPGAKVAIVEPTPNDDIVSGYVAPVNE